jgi:hypothetical protein
MRALAPWLAAALLMAGGLALARSAGSVGSAPAPATLARGVLAAAPAETGTPARAVTAAATVAADGATVVDADATLLLPDGSRVAALNGARAPQPLATAWPASVPFQPIVGIERSPAGIDWYVHADGSRSTTEMRWRADLGRDDAVTRLARAAPHATPRVPGPHQR